MSNVRTITYTLYKQAHNNYIRLKLPHLKMSREKQRQSMKKMLVVAGESNPGTLVLATSALTIEFTTTHNFHDLHILPLYCCVVPLLQSRTQQTTKYVPSEHIL